MGKEVSIPVSIKEDLNPIQTEKSDVTDIYQPALQKKQKKEDSPSISAQEHCF